jgi:hypothetical protein
MKVLLLVMLLVFAGAPAVDAEILFQEDFEDGNLSTRGWYDIAGWGRQQYITSSERRSGNSALEVRYLTGFTGPWMRRQFAGQDQVYTRYYRKWASDFTWPTSSGPHDTYLFGMYGQRNFAPTETYVTVYTESIYQGPGGCRFGTPGLGTRRYLQGESYRYPAALNPPPPPYQRDRWYCVETMATMNTPGASDGRMQVWIDGVQIFDVRNVLLRNAANADLKFDVFMFGPYFHGGAPHDQSTWMDALVVATDRVGCLDADTERPAAPANLRAEP